MQVIGINNDDFYRFCDTLNEQIAWYYNKVLESFSFKRKGDEWLLSIKTRGYGKGQIVFVAARTIGLCIQLFYVFCRSPSSSGCKWVMAKW